MPAASVAILRPALEVAVVQPSNARFTFTGAVVPQTCSIKVFESAPFKVAVTATSPLTPAGAPTCSSVSSPPTPSAGVRSKSTVAVGSSPSPKRVTTLPDTTG